MLRLTVALMAAAVATGCAMQRAAMPTLAPLAFEAQAAAAPPLEDNYFSKDRSAVSEADLKTILAAPVFLEEGARIGVLPVAAKYEADEALPVEATPQLLVESLEGSGLFELASEVSAEWPIDRGLPGLRELAARYRTEYLLLYRHRFNDVTRANPGAIAYLTVLGAFFIPGTTVDSAGVLEATLFDVKTGTILFTINERVRGSDLAAPPAVEARLGELHAKLVREGSRKLADEVVKRCRRLEAARPGRAKLNAVTLAPAS